MESNDTGEILLVVGGLALAWYLFGGGNVSTGTASTTTGGLVNPQTGQSAPAGYYWAYNSQTGQYQLVARPGGLAGIGAPVTTSSATFPPAAAPNGYYYAQNPATGAYQLVANPLGGAYGPQQSVFSAIGGSIGSSLGSLGGLIAGLVNGNGSSGSVSSGFTPVSLNATGLPDVGSLFGQTSLGQVDPTQTPSSNGLNYDMSGFAQPISSDLNLDGLGLASSPGSGSGYYAAYNPGTTQLLASGSGNYGGGSQFSL